MKMPERCLGAWAAAAAAAVVLCAPLAAQRYEPSPAVLALARARVDSGPATALVIAVVDSAGARYWSFGRLWRDSAAPAADSATVFEIGSVTKVFTATLLAELAARGEVALDDPVARLLPDSVRVPSLGGRHITLRDLATHRSGLPRVPANLFTGVDMRNPYAHYGEGQLYAFLPGYTLPREPGARYEYSNLGAGLLGFALARRVGLSYEEALQRRVLGPLGMNDTRIALTDSQRGRLARPHDQRGEASSWDLDALAGAGALRSTAADVARFLASQLGFVRTPLDSALRLTRELQGDEIRPGARIGLGWHARTAGGRIIYLHDGRTGGYASLVAFEPGRGVGVAVLTNASVELDRLAPALLGLGGP